MGCSPWRHIELDETEAALCTHTHLVWASQVALAVKNPPANAGDLRDAVQSLGWKDPLEEEIGTHLTILAWRASCTEEPGGLQSIGSKS